MRWKPVKSMHVTCAIQGNIFETCKFSTAGKLTFKLLIKSFSSWEASLENRNVFNAVLAAEKKKVKKVKEIQI